MQLGVSVAIDGPAGAGKSTVSRLLAERLGYQLLDTGAMYRSFAWALLQAGRPPESEWGVVLDSHQFDLDTSDLQVRATCDGVDISAAIRGPEVTEYVSEVAANPGVRQKAVLAQRQYVNKAIKSGKGVILEGRDIGTTVLPDATVKFFLTADSKARAKRRALELSADPGEVEATLAARDAADSSREVSPLQQAADAVLIDASHLTVEEVVDAMSELVTAAARRAPDGQRG